MRSLIATVMILAAGAAAAEPLPGPVPVDLVRVIDGDTVEVEAHIWPGHTVQTGVRLAGIDTPELRGRCPEEIGQAQAARDVLEDMVRDRKLALRNVEEGKFAGRVVATLLVDGQDAGAALVDLGLARRYDGGRREGWCGE